MPEMNPSKPETKLVVNDVHAYYGESHVLQGCSLEVGQESVVILGRNGMGKTTLMRSIMGLTPPKQGSILWKDKELHGMAPHKIAGMGLGYVPQGRRLFPSLTVDEHLKLTYKNSGGNNPWTPQRIYELFPELANRKIISGTRLSGGEQQMLAIGRAMVTDPDIIILDEPSEGLSPVAVDRVIDICRTLRSLGISILLVEQNIHVAEALADRIYIILSGQTVYESQASLFLDDLSLRQKYLGV